MDTLAAGQAFRLSINDRNSDASSESVPSIYSVGSPLVRKCLATTSGLMLCIHRSACVPYLGCWLIIRFITQISQSRGIVTVWPPPPLPAWKIHFCCGRSVLHTRMAKVAKNTGMFRPLFCCLSDLLRLHAVGATVAMIRGKSRPSVTIAVSYSNDYY